MKTVPGNSAFMAKVKAASEAKKKAKSPKIKVQDGSLFKVGDALTSKFDDRIHRVTKVLKSKIFYSENPDGSGPIHSDAHKIIHECFTFEVEDSHTPVIPLEKAPLEKKPLFLIMEKVWFDEIYSGRKKIEYRDDTPFYRSRFINKNGQFRNYDSALLQIGYHKDAKRMTIEITDILLDGSFEIHLGKITERNF